MRVDQAGDQCLAPAVQLEVQTLRPALTLLQLLLAGWRFIASGQQSFDLAIIVDQQSAETHGASISVDRDAVHIVDDPRRDSGKGQGERGGGRQKGALHALVIRLTSALVSCRLPPIACTSA